jgi:predicted RNase H-like HicB family nuclease
MNGYNKIIIKDNNIIGADLHVSFYYDEKNKEVIARFAPLMITTAGKDLSHAKEMFQEAFSLWVETVNEDGNPKDILEKLGWKVEKSEAVSKIKQSKSSELPFLTDNSFKLNIPAIVWAN